MFILISLNYVQSLLMYPLIPFRMSLATQERIADIVQNAKQMVAEAVDKVTDVHWPRDLT